MRVTERLRRRADDERGATVVIVTLLLVALFGMVALAVDVGGLVSKKRQVVRGTDAAALVAAEACADEDDYPNAQTWAQQYLQANLAGVTMAGFATTPGCGTDAAGAVTVHGVDEQSLPFAPVLGFPNQTDVNAIAYALWGPVSGGTVMPLEFPLSPASVLPCLEQTEGSPCAYWYDPSSDHDLGDASNYGFLNIGPGGIHPYPDGAEASCPAAGSANLDAWIRESEPVAIPVGSDRVYICFTSGHRNDTWFDALVSRDDDAPDTNPDAVPETFPINDPNCMVRTTGKEKACIVGFFTGYVTDVLRGNDPAAIGTPGVDGRCDGRFDFTPSGPNSTLDLDTWAACNYPGSVVDGPDSISNLQLRKGSGCCVQGPDADYMYDPSTHVITWVRGSALSDVRVTFDWSEGGVPGACGIRPSDPNAVCLVLEYHGVEVIRGPVCIGSGCPRDFGSRGVRLCDPLGEPAGSPCLNPPRP